MFPPNLNFSAVPQMLRPSKKPLCETNSHPAVLRRHLKHGLSFLERVFSNNAQADGKLTKGVTKCQIKKTIVNKAEANKVVVKVARLEVSRAGKAGSQAAVSKVVVKVARPEEVSKADKAGSQVEANKADRLVKKAERNRAYLIRCRDFILGTIHTFRRRNEGIHSWTGSWCRVGRFICARSG
jgi:hypothetical protein